MRFPMDRKQLVTIAITAVVSVIARELLSWVIAWAKITAQTETAKAKARTIFNKNNLAIVWNAFWLLFITTALFYDLRKTGPVTRWDVFFIVTGYQAVFLFLLFLAGSIASAVFRRKRDKLRQTQV